MFRLCTYRRRPIRLKKIGLSVRLLYSTLERRFTVYIVLVDIEGVITGTGWYSESASSMIKFLMIMIMQIIHFYVWRFLMYCTFFLIKKRKRKWKTNGNLWLGRWKEKVLFCFGVKISNNPSTLLVNTECLFCVEIDLLGIF